MADSYIDDPENSAAAFRDGWFHSGDWGVLLAPRVLRLAGRHDDLINAGGIKVPAARVEAHVRDLVRPRDCAVLSVNLDGGATSLGIALVLDTPDRDAVRRKLAEGVKLGATLGVKVIFLPKLPRLHNDKVDRVALYHLFEAPPPGSI
jgi:O-succinylbenzoic acid--CoA ligase